MTDPNTRRTPTEEFGEHRPIRRGPNWGAIIGWLGALILAWWLLSQLLGSREAEERDQTRVEPDEPRLELVLVRPDEGRLSPGVLE